MTGTDTPAPWHFQPPWRSTAERDRYERKRIEKEFAKSDRVWVSIGSSGVRLMRKEEWELMRRQDGD